MCLLPCEVASWIVDAAVVVTAVFTAGASGAAFVTVRQGQRVFRHAVEPDPHVQILQNPTTRTTDLVIFNAGGGFMKQSSYMLVAGGVGVMGYVQDGIIRPGERVHLHAPLPHSEDTECLVMWLSSDDSSWAVTRKMSKRRLRKGAEGPVVYGEDAWRRLNPLKSLDGVTWTQQVQIQREKP